MISLFFTPLYIVAWNVRWNISEDGYYFSVYDNKVMKMPGTIIIQTIGYGIAIGLPILYGY